MNHTHTCFANHLAAQWAIEPSWAERMVAQIKATGLPPAQAATDASRAGSDYLNRNGVAIVSIDGPMAKFDSSLGGANTVRLRAAVRAAAADEAVSAIVLRVDSPGGTVDGTMEFAADVAAANKIKPVYGFAEDLAASAALWVLAQARKVYANATALVGSIGVYFALVDSSKSYEMQGLKTIIVGSGGLKGAGAEGAPVSEEYVAHLEAIVADRTKFFIQAIADGRGMSTADVRALADGRVWNATDAKKLGLIDGVRTFDDVLAMAQDSAKPRRRERMAALVNLEAAE